MSTRRSRAATIVTVVASGGRRHRLVSHVWLVTGIVAVADFVFGATFVVFMQSRGLSATTIGGLLSITALSSMLLEAPSGAWGDRHGHKRLVAGGLGLWGIGLLLFGIADTSGLFGVGVALWAAGLALYSGAAMSLLINTLNADGREHEADNAIRGTETIRWAAAAAAAIIVAVTASFLSTQASIVLSGVALLVVAAWVLLRWPDSPVREHVSVLRSLRDGVQFVLAPGKGLLLAFTVITSADLAIVILTWQPLALHVVHLGQHLLGVALLVLSVAVAAGAFASRWVPKRFTGIGVGVSLLLLNGFLAVAVISTAGAVAAVVGAEFFLGVALTILAVWGQRLFPDRIRATATSVLGTASGVTMAITNGVMGAVWDTIGLQQAVTGAGIVGACVTVVIATVATIQRSRIEGRVRVHS